MSSPQDHIYMISRGWPHEALQAMAQSEFLFWFEEQRKFDLAQKEAQDEAIKQARDTQT